MKRTLIVALLVLAAPAFAQKVRIDYDHALDKILAETGSEIGGGEG